MFSRQKLLQSAQSFCTAFATKQDTGTIISHFSTSDSVSVMEYGLPVLAPFLGRSFGGRDGVLRYFGLLRELLSYEAMEFTEYMVDAEEGKVSVKGKARFKWLETQQEWDEIFTYTLDFDDQLKVIRYQIWADSGAAYLASKGKLA